MNFHIEDLAKAAERHWRAQNRFALARPETEMTIGDQIDDAMVDPLIELLEAWPDNPVVLMIDSNGGHVEAAHRLYTALRLHGAPTKAFVGEQCASSALLPLLGCKYRSAASYSKFLIHSAGFGEPILGRKTAQTLRLTVDELAKYDAEISDIICTRSFYRSWEVADAMSGEYWLNASTALSKGLIDLIA